MPSASGFHAAMSLSASSTSQPPTQPGPSPAFSLCRSPSVHGLWMAVAFPPAVLWAPCPRADPRCGGSHHMLQRPPSRWAQSPWISCPACPRARPPSVPIQPMAPPPIQLCRPGPRISFSPLSPSLRPSLSITRSYRLTPPKYH